jgi:hypothetical protein
VKSTMTLSHLLLLGRLDGRLQNSPARQFWLARARVSGAATIAGIAGVPVDVDDILNWICGRTPPPRHREGLNDPLSIAALFHLSLIAQEPTTDQLAHSTLAILRTVLDDRDACETWGRDDLVRFGAAYRQAQVALRGPYPAPTLLAVAKRVQEAHSALEIAPADGRTVSSIDGRQLTVEPVSFGTVWLLACHLPQAIVSAGLATHFIPTLVGLPRYLTGTVAEIASAIERAIGRAAHEGLAELDRLEHRLSILPEGLNLTRRSRLPELLRLELAYPGLRVPAIARLLGISLQGAAKLASQGRAARAGRVQLGGQLR